MTAAALVLGLVCLLVVVRTSIPWIGLGPTILGALSSELKFPNGENGPGPNPLALLIAEYSGFRELVSGKRVLDFWCGFGDQAGAIAASFNAHVTGLDILESDLAEAQRRYPSIRFVSKIPHGERFDVVISQNSMEHFPDPLATLNEMKDLLSPGASLLITFGFPWWHPYGSHCRFFCRLPWLQVWFSEQTIVRVRSRYRDDGATRFNEAEGGLNKMSLRKFNRLIRECGFKIRSLEYRGIKQQHWLTRIPLVREFCTGQITAVLGID